jgi:hypothetical protein
MNKRAGVIVGALAWCCSVALASCGSNAELAGHLDEAGEAGAK